MSAECSLYLTRHPSAPPGPDRSIQVTVLRTAGGGFNLNYRLDGDLSRIRLPSCAAFGVGNELWRHTCFEAFVAVDGESAYHEFNFAPSREWTLYAFNRYREGYPVPGGEFVSQIEVRAFPHGIELSAATRLDSLSAAHVNAPLRVGLSAVIETTDGFSYWALRHAGPKPDFHRRDGFTLLLPAPNRRP